MSSSTWESFVDSTVDPPVRGFLHHPTNPNGNGLVLTHGAGANCRSSLLMAISEAFANAGFTVLRCDLPFRQLRPFGPPHPSQNARDQEGLKRAVEALHKKVSGKVFLGGHSYGGRQATMICVEEPGIADGIALAFLSPASATQARATSHAALSEIANEILVYSRHSRSAWANS